MKAIVICCLFPLLVLFISTIDGSARHRSSTHRFHHDVAFSFQIDASSPDVIITEPGAATLTVNSEVFRLTALVLSPAGPLTAVTIQVNGTERFKTKLANESDSTRRKFQLDFQLPLEEGRNVITVIAASGKATSRQIRTVIYERSTAAKPNLIVLAIGVSEYKDRRLNQPRAHEAADAFAKLMKTQEGGLYGSVQSLVLANGEANRTGILKGLSWLNSEAKSNNDIRVLFLSGAFVADHSRSAYFLSPEHEPKADPDFANVSFRSMFARLVDVRSPLLVFLDASSFSVDGNPGMRGINSFAREGHSAMYMCCDGDDGPLPRAAEYSPFATALLEGLRGDADLSIGAPKDGVINVAELQMWLEARVMVLTKGQRQPSFVTNGSISRTLPIFRPATVQP